MHRSSLRRATARGADGHPLPLLRRTGVLAVWLLVAGAFAGCDQQAPPPPDDFFGASPVEAGEPERAADLVTEPVAVELPAAERSVALAPAEPAVLRVYQTSPVRGPRIGGGEVTHDWGVVQIGSEIHHTFQFRNAGDQPLRVLRASPTLGCCDVKFDHDLAPGDFGRVDVIVRTDKMKPGQARVAIDLQTTDRRSDTTLMLYGRMEYPGAVASESTVPAPTAAAEVASYRRPRPNPRGR